MKNIAITLLLVMVSCFSLNAQTVIGSSFGSNSNNATTTETKESSPSSEDNGSSSSVDADYYAVEKGWGVGLEVVNNGFLLGFTYCQGETNDIVTSNYTWSIHLGYNLRQWLIPNVFYLEGRFGVGYGSSKFEMTTYETKVHTTEGRYVGSHYIEPKTSTYTVKNTTDLGGDDVYLMLSPRAGVRLCKFENGGGIALTGGYRWHITKFKFDKEHTSDFFTVGLSITFD